MELEFYEKFIDSLHDGVYYVDIEKKIVFWNNAAKRITGYSKEEIIGVCCDDNLLCHMNKNKKDIYEKSYPIIQTLSDGQIRDIDVLLEHKQGHRVPVSVRISPIIKDGNIIGAVELFSDNSKRIDIIKEYERLRQDIYVDTLTMIGNKEFAKINIEQCINDQENFNLSFGILLIDIDSFENFNNKYGCDVGDKILIMVASTISNMLRPFDSVSRWDDQQFIVVVPNINEKILKDIAERIRRFIERNWITIDDKNLSATVSIGGTIAKAQDTMASTIERAYVQLHKSKKLGHNCVLIDK